MKQEEIQCLRCNTPMQIGFIADNADSGLLTQSKWIEGLPVNSKFFGMNTGTLNVKDRQKFPLTAYRCPVCSRIELFAINEEQDVLLRPAGIGEKQMTEELLRGSEAPNQEE